MFRVILFSTLCLVSPFAYQKISPFRLGKCGLQIPFNPAWEVPPSIPNLQSFTYLAEGTQAYVFLSQDKTVVLKLFKNQKGIEKTLDACRLAYDISDLTHVTFLHLNPKAGLAVFTVKDQWGRKHTIDPTHTRFLLQRTAMPFFKTLRNASSEERTELIQSFYSLMAQLRARGIANLDNSLGRNFGFIDGKAVAIDFGRFLFAPHWVDGREAVLMSRFNKWLLKNHFRSNSMPLILNGL